MFEKIHSRHGMDPNGFPHMSSMSHMDGFPNIPPDMGASHHMTGFNNARLSRQDPPIEHDLPVTLEEIFNGSTKRMKITKEIVIPGTHDKKVEPKILEINLKKGWKEGTRITFPKEGNQHPNRTPADIIFIIKDKKHLRFSRDKNNNLICRKKVSLKQALTGTTIYVETLDKNEFRLDFKQISPTTKRMIKGEGLPLPKRPKYRGDIIVEFDIQFPKHLCVDEKNRLKEILPH